MLTTTRNTSGTPPDYSSMVADVMSRLRSELLANGYENHCEGVALKVAFALIAEGRAPIIVYVDARDGGFLDPVQFENIQCDEDRVRWKTHAIAICDGLAYDPLLGRPVPEADYGLLEFGKEVIRKPKIEWTTEALRRSLDRKQSAANSRTAPPSAEPVDLRAKNLPRIS
jgi:hypothetical protein